MKVRAEDNKSTRYTQKNMKGSNDIKTSTSKKKKNMEAVEYEESFSGK